MSTALSIALKAQILDSLSKVESPSFIGESIKIFLRNVHTCTDYDLIEMINNLQTQGKDHIGSMKEELGNQFDFLYNLQLRH